MACRRALEKKDTHVYKCRYGFTEAISPLYNFGMLTGFLVMGQVVTNEEERGRIADILYKLGLGEEDSRRFAADIKRVNADMVSSYVKIMTVCAQYLTLSHAIPSKKPTIAQSAKKYVYDNYSKKINIKDICENIGCSKSTLITAFKKEFGMTVNNYLTELRLEEAEKLLISGHYSVGQVSYMCGFSDQSYFSKVFTAKYKTPPSEFIKEQR